jgi:hypothetical protein
MNPSVLTVFKSPFEKKRLGKDYDGGYIIAEIPNIKYKILLAGGIENDISFEEDFINKYAIDKAYAFDGTINNLPNEISNITFIKKNIGFSNDNKNIITKKIYKTFLLYLIIIIITYNKQHFIQFF